jgi:hypothetical protein
MYICSLSIPTRNMQLIIDFGMFLLVNLSNYSVMSSSEA